MMVGLAHNQVTRVFISFFFFGTTDLLTTVHSQKQFHLYSKLPQKLPVTKVFTSKQEDAFTINRKSRNRFNLNIEYLIRDVQRNNNVNHGGEQPKQMKSVYFVILSSAG